MESGGKTLIDPAPCRRPLLCQGEKPLGMQRVGTSCVGSLTACGLCCVLNSDRPLFFHGENPAVEEAGSISSGAARQGRVLHGSTASLSSCADDAGSLHNPD